MPSLAGVVKDFLISTLLLKYNKDINIIYRVSAHKTKYTCLSDSLFRSSLLHSPTYPTTVRLAFFVKKF